MTVVDQFGIGTLELVIGTPGAVLGTEQGAKHHDLRLSHGVQDVLAGLIAFVAVGGSPAAVAAASKALTTSPSSATVVPAMSRTAT